MAVFGGALANAQTVSYADAVAKVARSVEDCLKNNSSIAILNFDSSSEQFSFRVINDLTERFVNDGIPVVDRRYIEDVLKEQNFQLSNASEESAVSIGRMLGAQSIIIGSGENMVGYYHMQFTMIRVESAVVEAQKSFDVRYDDDMRRLRLGSAENNNIGSTHFLIGARLGAGFEINTADEDMVGEGLSPKEKSNTTFNASLYGAYKFNDIWLIQPELIFMINNGMEITGQGYTVKIDYSTLDIPLLIRYNFIQSPLLVGLVIGPYLSLPIGKLNLSIKDKGSSLDVVGISYGITAGFAIAKKLGIGFLAADIRFMHDFISLKVREDFGSGVEDAKIGIRRAINLTFGYEFSL